MTKLIFDIDFIIFDAVSVAEERFITATHIPTDRKIEFKNKTELWGHYKKKEGGWIAEQNKKLGNDFWKVADFDVVEGQRPRPFKIKGVDPFTQGPNESLDYFITPWDGAKKILDDKVKAICQKLGTTEYEGFTGTGDVFRHDLCTLLKYKDRDELMKPLLLRKMKEYVCERHSTTLVKGLEADDHVSIAVLAGYNKWLAGGKKDCDKVIGIAEDKDSDGCTGWWFNPEKDAAPRLIEGFGKLWVNDKGDVKGQGRMWLYFQIGCGDSSDNYSANCFSDARWGQTGAYKELKNCKTDKEAFEALVGIFKMLYPEPKTVEGCKGPVKIDAIYVMQECFTMAKMLRAVDEPVTDVKAVMDKLGVNYSH